MRRKSPQRRRSPVRILIKGKGDLTSLGYGMRNSARSRHIALCKAVRKYGYKSVMGKINTLYVFNKNKKPSLAKIAQCDKNYIKKKYGMK